MESSVSESASMATAPLPVTSNGTTGLIYFMMLAAVAMSVSRSLVLHHRAVHMFTAVTGLSITYVDMKPGSLGLTIKSKHRYASDNG